MPKLYVKAIVQQKLRATQIQWNHQDILMKPLISHSAVGTPGMKPLLSYMNTECSAINIFNHARMLVFGPIYLT
jgi:hypothetical protein